MRMRLWTGGGAMIFGDSRGILSCSIIHFKLNLQPHNLEKT
jgi:hypothetical protein